MHIYKYYVAMSYIADSYQEIHYQQKSCVFPRYNMNEECEKRRHGEVLHMKMKEMLANKEEQHAQ